MRLVFTAQGFARTFSNSNSSLNFCQNLCPKLRELSSGITGQDGSYLAELLQRRDTRCTASRDGEQLQHQPDRLYQDPHERDPRLVLHYGDLTDSTNLIRIIQQVKPMRSII